LTGDWFSWVRIGGTIESLKTGRVWGSGRGVGIFIGGLYPYTVLLVSEGDVDVYRDLDVSILDFYFYRFFIVGEGWDSDVPDLIKKRTY
jgi:hypothetical protein